MLQPRNIAHFTFILNYFTYLKTFTLLNISEGLVTLTIIRIFARKKGTNKRKNKHFSLI